jgi:hypothetical protein
MEFFLFILCNAALFIRPGEIVPAWANWPIYLVLITACTVVAFPRLMLQLRPDKLMGNPVTLCLVAFLLTGAAATQLGQAYTQAAINFLVEFGKIVLYYFLLMAVVDTPQRLRRLLVCLAFFITLLSSLALLQYYEIVELPGIKAALAVPPKKLTFGPALKFKGGEKNPNAFALPSAAAGPVFESIIDAGPSAAELEGLTAVRQKVMDEETGKYIFVPRLIASGIFSDPNDLSLILGLGIMICLWRLTDGGGASRAVLWLLPLGLFLYTFSLTRSRGGLLALFCGLMVLVRCRLGWPKTIALSLALLPGLAVMALRQANLGDQEDSAQARFHLWDDGFQLFREAPLTGIGFNAYAGEVGQVAHNSYVHAFVETGIFGGSFFTGIVFFALWPLERLYGKRETIVDPEMRRLLPFVMAAVGVYAAGMMSLSRNYVVPTYLVLGLGAVYLQMVATNPPIPDLKRGSLLPARLAALGTITVVCIFVAIKVLVHYGKG